MADYPTSLPTFAANGANLSTAPHSALHTDLNQEVVAIATTLGTAPQGTLSTVKARLDKIAPYTGALTAWTPSWTQAATITKTVAQATYSRVGRQITANFNMTATSAGTAANQILFGVPVNAAASVQAVGSVIIFDASISQFITYSAYMQGASSFGLLTSGSTGVASTPTIASGDIVFAQLSFEAAAD